MKLGEIVNRIALERLTPELEAAESKEICFCHASDYLSDVLSNAPDDSILITVQANLFILAIAVLKKTAAVVFPSGTRPEKLVIERAIEEGVPLYISNETVFTIAGRLYALGLRGSFSKPYSPFNG